MLGRGFDVTMLVGTDQQKLEMALRHPFEIVHFIGHGCDSAVSLDDDMLAAADLATLLESQRETLRFIVMAACEGDSTAVEIHNRVNVPVIYYSGNVEDKAAVQFTKSFYQHFAKHDVVGEAYEVARAALLIKHPQDAGMLHMINGDMATIGQLTSCMTYLKEELEQIRVQIAGLETVIIDLRERPRMERHLLIGLLFLLVIAQFATPWLNNRLHY